MMASVRSMAKRVSYVRSRIAQSKHRREILRLRGSDYAEARPAKAGRAAASLADDFVRRRKPPAKSLYRGFADAAASVWPMSAGLWTV